jgi:FMN phosphatase YigB (HAD superfamily)
VEENETNLHFDTIIFDLDDTLTDTEMQLVTTARLESLQTMAKYGLDFSVERALELWQEYLAQPRLADVFAFIAEQHSVASERADLVKVGREMFYQRDVPKTFRAFAECGEILSRLKAKYDLYLVTSGDVETQKQKVTLTGLGSFFNSVFYVDHMKDEKKSVPFQKILIRHAGAASRILVVGNRLDHEIREGKRLGMKTCWIMRGEHRHQQPLLPEDYADFRADHVREVIRICHL